MDTKAKKNNMLTIAARTPTYEEGDSTWWLQSNKTNAYLQAPINQVAYSGYNIDKTKILFSGYSCCTEFLSYYVSAYSSTFCGGGAMISGGGGASSSAPGAVNATADFRKNFRMHWYTDQNDTSANVEYGFCGIFAVRQGSTYYTNQSDDPVPSRCRPLLI